MTKEQMEFINENYKTKGPKYCAEELSINKSTVSSYATRKGLSIF